MNYIFLADGFETVEALAVVDMLVRAKLPITMVSMNDTLTVTTSHKIPVIANVLFKEANFSDADTLILPGGMPGTNNLQNNPELCKLITSHRSNGGRVAAICAAPKILGALHVLDGKRACCFPGFEEELLGAKVSKRAVEVDDGVITSRGMGTACLFAAAIIEELAGKELADNILSTIQWNTSEA